MKSHTFAKELIALGEVLLSGPNIEMKKLPLSFGSETGEETVRSEMAFGITTLVELSKFSRTEWVSFVSEHNLPVEFNQRDSSRNIIGKIMSYLASHETELQRVKETIVKSSNSSNRLNKAFDALLKVPR